MFIWLQEVVDGLVEDIEKIIRKRKKVSMSNQGKIDEYLYIYIMPVQFT